MEHFDAIVIGGGVIGTSIACHLARFGAGRVLLLERGTLGSGTSAQSSCIVRTHYSVPHNLALAQAALAIFRDFPNYLDDPEAECGLNACGLMLVAPPGERAVALRATLALQRACGLDAREIGSRRGAAHSSAARFRRRSGDRLGARRRLRRRLPDAVRLRARRAAGGRDDSRRGRRHRDSCARARA